MKYFTPELFVALQADDDDAMDAADAAWEDAVEAYSKRLSIIREGFPESACDLLDKYQLHDAVIEHLGQDGEKFVIVLRLEWPRGVTLILIYDITAPPMVKDDALPERHRASHCQWMYDEIDLGIDGVGFTHSIFLSNGLEIGMQFHAVRVLSIQDLLVETHALAQPA